ncbi:hypothetical protein BDW66DRAFT_151438 [Aspergillus desertorum]
MTSWMSYSTPSYPYPTSATLVPATLSPPTMSSYRDSLDMHASATDPPATSDPFPQTPNPAALSPANHVRPPKDETPIKVEEEGQQEADGFLTALLRPWPVSQAEEQGQREANIFPKALSYPVPADRANEDAESNENQFPRINASRAEVVTLLSLDVDSVSESDILYYFGVLATEALLLPRFQFTKGRKNRYWGVKMTIYGMTFIRSHVYESRRTAKVSICREALKKLRVEFPNWVVPEGPKESLAPSSLDWVETLQEYCVHSSLPEPVYTKYVHHKGYRHEVEIDGDAYFAPLKYYAAELQSKQGAAHVALYNLLVREDYGRVDAEGHPTSLKKSNGALLAVVPGDAHRKSTERMESECLSSRKRSHETLSDVSAQNCLRSPIGQRASSWRLKENERTKRARRRGGKNRSPATTSQVKPAPGNANLQPLKNCRLAVMEVPVIQEERRWEVTPSDISRELQDVGSWVAKLERESWHSMLEEVCNLLKLEHPEIRIDRSDGRLIETEGQYTAAAYFKSDPFLARAGAIGRIQAFSGTRIAVHEACAWNVCDYLIDLVMEDMMLEDKKAKEREAITRWGETAGK